MLTQSLKLCVNLKSAYGKGVVPKEMKTDDVKHILIVEDDVEIANLMATYLKQAEFAPDIAYEEDQALSLFRSHSPVCVILDRMLPGSDGLDICKTIRAESDVPILFVTARMEEADRLEGLRSGADDYIIKPFSFLELVARVEAIMRRTGNRLSTKTGLTHGYLVLHPDKQEISWRGETLLLTISEYKLLHKLISFPSRVFSREELLTELYPYATAEVIDRVIDVHIGNIRKKLNVIEEGAGECILTVRGFGYRLS
jgi:DNA-binding response OmpR family regulator